jgi:hypothetical protein
MIVALVEIFDAGPTGADRVRLFMAALGKELLASKIVYGAHVTAYRVTLLLPVHSPTFATQMRSWCLVLVCLHSL